MDRIDISSYSPLVGINSLVDPGKNNDKAAAEDAKLKRTCNEFEAVLTSIILKEGLKSAQEMGDGIDDTGDNGSKKYNEMAYEQIAYFIGKQGMMGLGNMIYEKVRQQINDQNIKAEGLGNEQPGS